MRAKELLVADVMAIDPVAVDIDASIEEADRLLRSTSMNGIPVVDGGGVLVGVIGHAHLTAYRFAHRRLPSDAGTDPHRGPDAVPAPPRRSRWLVANMYFIPEAIAIRSMAPDGFWAAIDRVPADFPNLTLEGFLANLLPVTIGNVIGGAVMVGVVYWFVYLRVPRSPGS